MKALEISLTGEAKYLAAGLRKARRALKRFRKRLKRVARER